MQLHDSRRLTGPNRYGSRPGAVLEVLARPEDHDRLIAAWGGRVRQLLDAVGWQSERISARRFDRGVGLVITAPIDLLYTATELNEAALVWAVGGELVDSDGAAVADSEDGATPSLDHGTASGTATAESRPSPPPFDEAAVIARLQAAIAREARPAARALQAAAEAHRVRFVWGDDAVSVGLGTGAITWPVDELPSPEEVPWSKIYDVPVVAVTGTNGKSTSVRLVASMVAAADLTPGASSTDGVRVGEEWTVRGDYSGPEGTRRVVRHPRVQAAVLETARGGLARRGLGVWPLDAALVTNLAPDHLGGFGLATMADLADIKLVIAGQVQPGGRVVLNADDPLLVGLAGAAVTDQGTASSAAATVASEGGSTSATTPFDAPITWFSLDVLNPIIQQQLAAGGDATWLEDGAVWLAQGGSRRRIAAVGEIPITMGGAVRYNVANALGAAALGAAIGLSPEAIAAGLMRFSSTPEDNPGRANVFTFRGVTALVDYAHNPHGLDALYDTVMALPARRRLVVLGQAGDRDDEAIRAMARAALRYMPDHAVVKELPRQIRGRPPGEVPAILRDELIRQGVAPEAVEFAPNELAATRQALAWAQTGDLLILLTYAERPEVLALLAELERNGWGPGAALQSSMFEPHRA